MESGPVKKYKLLVESGNKKEHVEIKYTYLSSSSIVRVWIHNIVLRRQTPFTFGKRSLSLSHTLSNLHLYNEIHAFIIFLHFLYCISSNYCLQWSKFA